LSERFPVLALEMGSASKIDDPAPFYTIFPQRNIAASASAGPASASAD